MRDALYALASSVAAMASSARAFPTSLKIKGAQFFSGTGVYEAKVTSDGELAITETERERNVAARYTESGINSTRYAILVDLSDTSGFKHDQTGRIDISYMSMQIDKETTARGRVAIGVITAIDGTNATIRYFASILFDNSADDHLTRDRNFSPSQVKCGVSGGALTKIVSNDSETTASVNTGVSLNSSTGSTVTPAVGDIIIKMDRLAGTFSTSIFTLYHAESAA